MQFLLLPKRETRRIHRTLAGHPTDLTLPRPQLPQTFFKTTVVNANKSSDEVDEEEVWEGKEMKGKSRMEDAEGKDTQKEGSKEKGGGRLRGGKLMRNTSRGGGL